MKRIISERRLVVVLFVLVFVTFSFAHEDSKKLEQIYSGFKTMPSVELTASQTATPVILTPGLVKKETVKTVTPP